MPVAEVVVDDVIVVVVNVTVVVVEVHVPHNTGHELRAYAPTPSRPSVRRQSPAFILLPHTSDSSKSLHAPGM